MPTPQTLLPLECIAQNNLLIRGGEVILDADPASLYGIPTKVLNQAIKRNTDRFPEDFAFRLTAEETSELVTKCDRFAKLKHSSVSPLAYTEDGAIAAAFVLNSPMAVQVSLQVIRAFVQLRKMAEGNQVLARKIADLERCYDNQFTAVFEAIHGLMEDRHTHGPDRVTLRRKDG